MRVSLVLLTVLLVAGCGADDHGPEVPATAGDAVDCAGTPYAEGRGNYDTGPESRQDDAVAALEDWRAAEWVTTEDMAFEEAARHGDRVLFSWTTRDDVVGAVVVGDDHGGWGVATYALCDPAEWPPEVAERAGYEVWANADGDRVPTTLVVSHQGPEHCDWEDTTFLTVGEEQFLGRPGDDFAGLLRTTYAEGVPLPADARDTGYRREGRALWLAADGSAAYLVDAGGAADRWPGATEPIGCA